jgi:hypothetical protein
MTTQHLTERIQQKLLMKLLEFNYTIEYKKGKENTAADALSRKQHQVNAISSAVPTWITDIEASYHNDIHFTNIIQQLAINPEAVPNYTLHTGILRHNGRICVGSNTELKDSILSSLHSSSIGGGIQESMAHIKESRGFSIALTRRKMLNQLLHTITYVKEQRLNTSNTYLILTAASS